MNKLLKSLPNVIDINDVSLAPIGWVNLLLQYPQFREKADHETKPGYFTLLAFLLVAIARHDKKLVDFAIQSTKKNVPKNQFLSLVGTVLCDIGSKHDGLKMLRDAVNVYPSPSVLAVLAANSSDLNEKENLSKQILKIAPQNCDAIREMAYVKHMKGDTEEAERMLDGLLLREPDNKYVLMVRGNIFYDRRNYLSALEQYQKINIQPVPVLIQMRICCCHYFLGNTSKAVEIARVIKDDISRVYEKGETIQRMSEIIHKLTD